MLLCSLRRSEIKAGPGGAQSLLCQGQPGLERGNVKSLFCGTAGSAGHAQQVQKRTVIRGPSERSKVFVG